MKAKKHISPLQVLSGLYLFSGWSGLFLLNVLGYESENLYRGVVVSISIIVVLIFVASLVINILSLRNKDARRGDEFTTQLLRRSGYISFCIVSVLLTLLFCLLQIAMLVSDSLTGMSLKSLLDFRFVLAAAAGIQLIGTFVFSLLYFLLSRKGSMEGV